MLIEIVRQIKEPAPVPRRIPEARGLARLTGAYLLACTSSVLLATSCGIGNNPRLFTGSILQLHNAEAALKVLRDKALSHFSLAR
jgi:hypothetical protein